MTHTIQSHIKQTCLQSQSTLATAMPPLLILLLSFILIACESTPDKNKTPISPYNYVDSTEYFAERTGSVSMRATFSKKTSTMDKGYQFQFRTINSRPVFLNSISIVAGGKRIFLEEGQIVLPPQKGATLTMSLEDSLFVGKYPSALLQFRQNNISQIFAIELHQLKAFVPR